MHIGSGIAEFGPSADTVYQVSCTTGTHTNDRIPIRPNKFFFGSA